MQEVLIPASRAALFCALAALAPLAHGIALGEIEVRSALGERLDARIPVTPTGGESVDSKCFSLLRDAEPGIPALTEGRLSVEQVAGSPVLRVRTSAPVSEPAVLLRVRAACAAGTGEALRQYTLLLDPRAGSGATISPPAIAATVNARPGDTLEAIAAKVVRGRAARRDYLAAIRALNPPLAALGAKEPLPEGTEVALPDLRTYARLARAAPALPSAATELAAREPAPARLPVERKSPPKPAAIAAAPVAAEPAAPPPAERAAPKAAPKASSRPASRPASSTPSGPGFVLKLSNAEVDLSPSRRIDDRARSQLRERLLVLDNDDQVAALLSMRNSLKQLEGRVAELQLKLAQMPPSLAARSEAPPAAPTPAPAKAPAPPAKAPPVAAAPSPAAPPAEKPSVAATPAVVPAPAPKLVAPPAPKPVEPPAAASKPVEPPAPAAKVVEPPPPAPKPVEPPAPAAKVVEPPPPAAKPSEPAPPRSEAVTAPSPRPAVKPRRPAIDEGGLSPWLWGLVAVLSLFAILLALRLWRRKREASQDSAWATDTDTLEPEEAGARAPEDDIFAEEPIEVAHEVQHEEHPELQYEARRSMASDADLETRLPQNSGELRRRYIEERFPEIVNRSVVLDDPASVVKGARLFYEDRALPRAVELLQFSIEENPAEVKTWLALFEIFRLERLETEFAALARRFQEHHGKSDYWAKVQYFGREIDPGNALYKESSINTLETIGPSEARRLARANASFDPIAENWLNAPMDFENEVLANELRQALMVDASLTEQDLIPNPMPALRNIEMFTVA